MHYLGLLHVQLGHLHQGMDLIRQSLAIDPHQVGALGNLAGALGKILCRLGRRPDPFAASLCSLTQRRRGASPAIAGKALYVRSDSHLYRIEEK